MTTQMMVCEAEALKLPPAERASLAQRLIASLDDLSDGQIEQLWLDEATRRDHEYKAGNVGARSADDALRDARAALS